MPQSTDLEALGPASHPLEALGESNASEILLLVRRRLFATAEHVDSLIQRWLISCSPHSAPKARALPDEEMPTAATVMAAFGPGAQFHEEPKLRSPVSSSV